MAIPKTKYEELKEYWDYQRKIAYNKEVIYHMADRFQNRVYNATSIPLHLMGVVVFSSEGVVFGNCVESHFVRVTASSWKST